MIPKIIHYCWFGPKPFPELAKRCVASWQKYMPEYELKLWSEQNYDVTAVPFVAEAYRQGKYAFVSDYVRLWTLYREGGVYLDTDVELLRSLDPICDRGAWMGREPNVDGYMPALGLGFALPQGHWFAEELLGVYDALTFPSAESSKDAVITIVHTATKLLQRYGLHLEDAEQMIRDVVIYPARFFSPKCYHTGRIKLTKETYSIHHYDASWMTSTQKYKDRLVHYLGPLGQWLLRLKAYLSKH